MAWHDWFQHNEWHDAPARDRRLRDMLTFIIIQNEAILAKVEDRASKLSPEDQAKLNQIFDKAAATSAKLAEAQKT